MLELFVILKGDARVLSEILLPVYSEVCWTENGVMAMSNAKGRWRRVSSKMAGGEFAEEAGIQPVHTHLQLACQETVAPDSYCSNPRVF